MFVRMSGASEGRGAIRGKARGPAVGAKRRLPGPGKTKVTSAAGLRLSPRSGRQARSGGVEGAPWGRTGAGVNRSRGGRGTRAAPAGDCNREGGRGNIGAAVVHKAGEERRFGATPATATPLPSSSERRLGLDLSIWRQEKPSPPAAASVAWVGGDGEDVGRVGLDLLDRANEALSPPATVSDAWVGRDSAADRVPGQKPYRRAEPGPGRLGQGGAPHPILFQQYGKGTTYLVRWRCPLSALGATGGCAQSANRER